MQADSGGLSTFGALSTVLFAMGKRWQMRTPPYIILLIRTFLTLERVVRHRKRPIVEHQCV